MQQIAIKKLKILIFFQIATASTIPPFWLFSKYSSSLRRFEKIRAYHYILIFKKVRISF